MNELLKVEPLELQAEELILALHVCPSSYSPCIFDEDHSTSFRRLNLALTCLNSLTGTFR